MNSFINSFDANFFDDDPIPDVPGISSQDQINHISSSDSSTLAPLADIQPQPLYDFITNILLNSFINTPSSTSSSGVSHVSAYTGTIDSINDRTKVQGPFGFIPSLTNDMTPINVDSFNDIKNSNIDDANIEEEDFDVFDVLLALSTEYSEEKSQNLTMVENIVVPTEDISTTMTTDLDFQEQFEDIVTTTDSAVENNTYPSNISEFLDTELDFSTDSSIIESTTDIDETNVTLSEEKDNISSANSSLTAENVVSITDNSTDIKDFNDQSLTKSPVSSNDTGMNKSTNEELISPLDEIDNLTRLVLETTRLYLPPNPSTTVITTTELPSSADISVQKVVDTENEEFGETNASGPATDTTTIAVSDSSDSVTPEI